MENKNRLRSPVSMIQTIEPISPASSLMRYFDQSITKDSIGTLYELPEAAGSLSLSILLQISRLPLPIQQTFLRLLFRYKRMMRHYRRGLHAENGILAVYYDAASGEVTYVDPAARAQGQKTVKGQEAVGYYEKAKIV